MKKVLLSLLLVCSATHQGFSTESYSLMDGFCVMEVLNLQGSSEALSGKSYLPDADRRMIAAAIKRAEKFYKSYYGIAWEPDYGEPFFDTSVFVVDMYGDSLGVVVKVYLDEDEDLMTFYFLQDRDDREQSLLKLAIHDNQSADALWFCEQ